MPKLDEGMKASWLHLFVQMYQGKFEGFFAWGQNPACSSAANSGKTRQALTKLKWMVNVNLWDNETASFWKGPGMKPEGDRDRGLLPALRSSVEKEGSISNSSRLAQWRYQAIKPMGQSMPDADIMNELYFRVKKLYKTEGGKFPAPIVNLTWNYGEKNAEGKIDTSIFIRWPRRSTATTSRTCTTRPRRRLSSSAKRATSPRILSAFRQTGLLHRATGSTAAATRRLTARP